MSAGGSVVTSDVGEPPPDLAQSSISSVTREEEIEDFSRRYIARFRDEIDFCVGRMSLEFLGLNLWRKSYVNVLAVDISVDLCRTSAGSTIVNVGSISGNGWQGVYTFINPCGIHNAAARAGGAAKCQWCRPAHLL